ncbi:hypothetical protein Sru01_19390 [Sphaerisporangium rufum]|uniref:Uncharacterized protein n=1 Tax=Sphaerisporangium rufum TaxID=1381558 RepID=A0A919R4L6_9ACTN|nr:hypothetical protein [Sphaerisporangium rufum]GII76957.1 hypothetical protein Sru01_19390 [Sphaerisporangium rufum]
MLRTARALLFAALPAELLLGVLLLAGVTPPPLVIAAAEAVVAAVLLLEAVVAGRLFRAERRLGASRRQAARATVRRLVPAPVRRIVGFETKGMHSVLLWATRRRDGVPPGATALPYVREQATVMLLLLFAMVVETVAVELILRALEVPDAVRIAVLVVDVYGVFVGLAVVAACATRPHVVTGSELGVRYGAFFDARVPRELISAVRATRRYDETGVVRVTDGRAAVAVSSQTNITVELAAPVTVVRPLGRTVEITAIRFFTDTPDAALAALRPEPSRRGVPASDQGRRA